MKHKFHSPTMSIEKNKEMNFCLYLKERRKPYYFFKTKNIFSLIK